MTRHWRLPALASLLLAAACTDAGSPLSPAEPTPDASLQALDCSVVLADRSVSCRTPAAPRAGSARMSSGLIVGGQNLHVRVTSSNVSAANGRLSFDMTVQNLLPQALGTTDGVNRDPGGVRVFFQSGPVALPSGTATVANADGDGAFLATGQPYFQYDTILHQNETTAPKTWEIAFTPGVERINFALYVAAAVKHEAEWVDVSPRRTFLLPGDSGRIVAVVRDRVGRPLERPIAWSSSDTTIATVDSTGRIKGVRLGIAYINAESGSSSGGAPVIVVTRETAVTMDVTPDSAVLEMGQTVQLSARTYNLRGEHLDDYAVWADGNIWVAVVNGTGLVRGTYPGTTSVMAVLHWAEATATIRVKPGPEVAWKAVTTGMNYSCGVTTGGKAYCWGSNTSAQLGIGMWNQYGENIPVAIDARQTFETVDAGLSAACGLSTGATAYCWGRNDYGQLGDGSAGAFDPVPTPVAVVGGHRFSKLTAGHEHVCAIRQEDGRAYCWGNNSYGQLGNDVVSAPFNSTPVAVVGGLTFEQISAGRDFTCAITTADDLYCWGANSIGQLGDGASAPALMVPRPVAVAGGRKWQAVATGDGHACAVTTGGEVYCWGADRRGELGRGVANDSSDVPVKIAAEETFRDVGVGSLHSCAVATSGVAWCWGYNEDGQLGRGTKDSKLPHPTPQPVVGNVSFAGPIEGGDSHTCALGVDGRAWCWGRDFAGEAGVQPDVEFCIVPGGSASCQTRPRAVTHPSAAGGRTGPEVGFLRSQRR